MKILSSVSAIPLSGLVIVSSLPVERMLAASRNDTLSCTSIETVQRPFAVKTDRGLLSIIRGAMKRNLLQLRRNTGNRRFALAMLQHSLRDRS
jgi:hypothetical protein